MDNLFGTPVLEAINTKVRVRSELVLLAPAAALVKTLHWVAQSW
jgi:hypothetical protein